MKQNLYALIKAYEKAPLFGSTDFCRLRPSLGLKVRSGRLYAQLLILETMFLGFIPLK